MKAVLICNPAAGGRSCSDEILEASAYLESEGWEVAPIRMTRGPGDATTFAREAAAEGADVVFIAGGDGSVAQAVDGLVGTDVALGLLPAGTGNVMARQLNLPIPSPLNPRPMVEAARLLSAGQIRKVDVGRMSFTGSDLPVRHFLLWGGIGLDAAFNQEFNRDPMRKRRLPPVAFMAAAYLTIKDFAGTSATVRIDGKVVSRRLLLLVASNIQVYAIVIKLGRAVIDDGWLDAVLYQGRGIAHSLRYGAGWLLRQTVPDPEIEYYRARRIEVSTTRALPVHVDGDQIGTTPITIEVVPGALNLLVPATAPGSLFSDGAASTNRETLLDWMRRGAREAQTAIKDRSIWS